MPSLSYHKVSDASTNEEVITDQPAEITGWFITNSSGFYRFVKLFNSATLPTLSVTTPTLTLGIPILGAANVALDSPLTFESGITIAMVSGIEIGAVGAVLVEELSVDIFYELTAA